jgi:TadE-like protein
MESFRPYGKRMRASKFHKRTQRNGGQAMVEFALSFPFLLIILFSVLFFGQYFLTAQALLYAAQQGALIASRTPNLTNSTVRDAVRGFTTAGAVVNTNSVIYGALNSAQLLRSGNLPPSSSIEILPWDPDATETPPAGTIEVKINYPFQPFGTTFGTGLSLAMTVDGSRPPFRFLNFTVTERATAAQQIFQLP